jgi:DNA-binding MarR family transcriptional regulator
VSDRSAAVDAWEALYRAQVAVLRQLRADFPDGISITEYDVLFNLSRQDEHALRIRELNKHLLLTQPSVSRLLDRLVTRGFIAKTADPDDARGTIVTLTEAGYTEFRRVGAQHSRSIAQRMAALTPEELATLTAITDKLRDSARPTTA